MSTLYAGSICGTSLDGIDVALVEFPDSNTSRVIHYDSVPLNDSLAAAMRAIVFDGQRCDALTLGQLDQRFGVVIAEAILALLKKHNVSAAHVKAIGSHGINLLHAPDEEIPVTLQIGDPNQIARITNITTVADFRRRDVALGGQGAPLAPAFHAAVMADKHETRVVLNLGGIANITVLEPGHPVIGFDTGPANGLLDAWYVEHHATENVAFDRNGAWGSCGTVNQVLLEALASDDYFLRPPPKSTGKEHFNMAWLKGHLGSVKGPLKAQDVQTTLAELTALTVCNSIKSHCPDVASLLVCGGGAHNENLMTRLRGHLPSATVSTTEPFGVAPDHVEAAAFAWLAKRTLEHASGNLASVTGAAKNSILGGVYFA
ncbi:MAG: anhydro-N-acetylmuramic acid kinase [Gammaproteobacteria bacterium]